MANPSFRVLLHWLPAALAMLVIAVESTTFMSASNTSRWLLPLWEHLFGPIPQHRWSLVHALIRKSGHFIGYGLVSLCFFHGFRTTLRAANGLRALWMRSSILALGCTVLVASADELHQAFLPNRSGSPLDVALDTCGGVLAQLIILAAMPFLTRKRAASPSNSLAPK